MNKLQTFVRYDLPVIFKMMLPTLFIMAVSIHFNEFIVTAIEANKAINSGIIIAAGFGIVIIIIRLISTQADMSALDRFSREAQATGDMKKLLAMPWLKGRAIRHYLEHLAHTGGTLTSQLDQDAIQNELNALNEEYNSKMELPQFLVGFMVAMGLLGTFIGLLETLTGISGMLDGMGHGGDIEQEFTKLVVELRKPLAGMGIAFSASMFGLVTSLQLSIMMIMLRRYTSRVMEKARNVMHKLLTRIKASAIIENAGRGIQPSSQYRYAHSIEDSFMDETRSQSESLMLSGLVDNLNASDAGSKISEAFFKSQDAVAELSNSMGILIKRIDVVAKALESNVTATQKTNALLNFGPRMVEVNEELVSEVKNFNAVTEDSRKFMQKIINSLIQIDQSLLSNSTRDVVSVERDTLSTLNEMFSATQTHTRLFSELLESQRESTHHIGQLLKTLHDKMGKQDESFIGAAKHLFDIKETFAQANNSFSLIDALAENIGRQTLLIEASLTEERNTQRALIGTIQRELREFTMELKRNLNFQDA